MTTAKSIFSVGVLSLITAIVRVFSGYTLSGVVDLIALSASLFLCSIAVKTLWGKQ